MQTTLLITGSSGLYSIAPIRKIGAGSAKNNALANLTRDEAIYVLEDVITDKNWREQIRLYVDQLGLAFVIELDGDLWDLTYETWLLLRKRGMRLSGLFERPG